MTIKEMKQDIRLAYNTLADEGYMLAREAVEACEGLDELSENDVKIEYLMHVTWAASDKQTMARCN